LLLLQAVLQLLDSKLSAVSAWYEDSSWADGIQQQLAAIEQAFAAGMHHQLQPAAGQAGDATLQAAAAAAAACSSELLWARSNQAVSLTDASQQQLQPAAASGTAATTTPTAKAYVTTPSGHVSMISSRRGTQVLSALDAMSSSSRRSTMVDRLSGNGSSGRQPTCSSIWDMPSIADDAAEGIANGSSSAAAVPAGEAAPARHRARRSTLGVATKAALASSAQHQQQQREPTDDDDQQPGTLLVLSEAAQRLSVEQEAEQQQQQQLQGAPAGWLPHWRSTAAVAAAAAIGGDVRELNSCSNAPVMLLDDETWVGDDGDNGAADSFEDCSSQQLPANAEQEQQQQWSPAAALVDAMQQAALAVLTQQQQPQLLEQAGEQQQQQQQQEEPALAGGTSSSGQVHGAAHHQQAATDADDAFWDAEEAGETAAVFCNDQPFDETFIDPAAAAGQQQQHSRSLQLLKDQLAEQRARTQQLQQQLELEQLQPADAFALNTEAKITSSPGCSPTFSAAGVVQQLQGLPVVQSSFSCAEASSSCVTEWGSILGEPQHAACTVVGGESTVRLGGAAGVKGDLEYVDTAKQLMDCRAALAAQHAACEELWQQNQQLMAALQQAGCSI
jgi:hypothetical protein